MQRLAGKIVLLSGAGRLATAFAAGAAGSFAQAPFDLPIAAFVAFTLLVWLLDGIAPDPRRSWPKRVAPSLAVGWWFGFGYFLAGLWWVGGALLVEADQFAWALPLAVIGLPALLAAFYALACALARALWSDGLGRIFALAVSFALAEWLRSFAFSGFPWNAVGYAAMPVPLAMQSLAVVGYTGANALAVFLFAVPALLAEPRRAQTGFALAGALLVLHLGYGAVRLHLAPDPFGAPSLAVRVVQPSILQSQKWDMAERDRIFAEHLALTTLPPQDGADPADVIVWPETSVPFLLSDRPDALVALGEATQAGQRLLAGIVRMQTDEATGQQSYYNSIVAIDDTGEIVDSFDKVWLVPFGEYLPFSQVLESIGLRQIAQNVGGFSSGASRRPLDLGGRISALPYICYELIFPGAVERGGASLLVNVTNDAWFGRTPGPYQHFRQAQLRTVEAGLPLVRAANNGISAALDGYGRVIDGLALDAVGVLDVSVPLVPADRLLAPARPQAIGWSLVAVMALSALIGRRKQRNWFD